MDNLHHRSQRYQTIVDVPASEWKLQGTIYQSPMQAKFAAAKLFCNVRSVVVKPIRDGWTLLYLPSRQG